jgi:hypothetical protein
MAASVASPNNPINVPAPGTLPPGVTYNEKGEKVDSNTKTTTRNLGDGTTEVDQWNGGRTHIKDGKSTVIDAGPNGSIPPSSNAYGGNNVAPDSGGGYGTVEPPPAPPPAPRGTTAAPACTNCGTAPATTTAPAPAASQVTAEVTPKTEKPVPVTGSKAEGAMQSGLTSKLTPRGDKGDKNTPTSFSSKEGDGALKDSKAALDTSEKMLKDNKRGSKEWVTAQTKVRDDAAAYNDAAIAYKDKVKAAKTPEEVTSAKNYKETVLDPAKAELKRSVKAREGTEALSPEMKRIDEKKTKLNEFIANIAREQESLGGEKSKDDLRGDDEEVWNRLCDASKAASAAFDDLDKAEKAYAKGDTSAGEKSEKSADTRVWKGDETSLWGAAAHASAARHSRDHCDYLDEERTNNVVFGATKKPEKEDGICVNYGAPVAKDKETKEDKPKEDKPKEDKPA